MFEQIVFMQGDEGSEALQIYRDNGLKALFEYLEQWHHPGEHETRDDLGNGSTDKIARFGQFGRYYLTYNTTYGYCGLSYKVTKKG